MIENITGICNNPLHAMISPKSVPVALTMKLLTVNVSPDVNANKQPRAKFIFALCRSCRNSSSESMVSSTER